MANYMVFQVAIYSFWNIVPYDLLGGTILILFETWLKGVSLNGVDPFQFFSWIIDFGIISSVINLYQCRAPIVI